MARRMLGFGQFGTPQSSVRRAFPSVSAARWEEHDDQIVCTRRVGTQFFGVALHDSQSLDVVVLGGWEYVESVWSFPLQTKSLGALVARDGGLHEGGPHRVLKHEGPGAVIASSAGTSQRSNALAQKSASARGRPCYRRRGRPRRQPAVGVAPPERERRFR
jgi:hypothetical protein